MGRLSILSVGLFVLPIAITIAILVGVETWRVSQGKPSLANQDNRLTTAMYCQQEYGVQPNPGRYICELQISPALAQRGSSRPAKSCPTFVPDTRQNSATGAILVAAWAASTVSIFRPRRAKSANTEPVNPNQWGVVAGDPLTLCMNVRHHLSRFRRQLNITISVGR